MTDAAPFIAAIRAAPDDDAPRLVYADWLDEHGDSPRAEFIRVQCELARRESADLRVREAELFRRHHDAFAADLAAPGLQFWFERGFIVGFGHSGAFLDRNRRAGVDSLLRFYSNGHVITEAIPLRPAEGVRPGSHSGNPPVGRGRYTLDVDVRPAAIAFTTISDGTGSRIDYRGVLKKTALYIEAGGPGEKGSRPRRYKLECYWPTLPPPPPDAAPPV